MKVAIFDVFTQVLFRYPIVYDELVAKPSCRLRSYGLWHRFGRFNRPCADVVALGAYTGQGLAETAEPAPE